MTDTTTPPPDGRWQITCTADRVPPDWTYGSESAAHDVIRLHSGACPGRHDVTFVPDEDLAEPDDTNVVLTFADADGNRWLAGAVLGPLVAETDISRNLQVADLVDKALTLVSFKVVRSAAAPTTTGEAS